MNASAPAASVSPTQQLSERVSCTSVNEFREEVAKTLEALQQLLPMLAAPVPNVPQAHEQLAADFRACTARLSNLRQASASLKASLSPEEAVRLPMFDEVIADMEQDVAEAGRMQQRG